MNSSQGVAGFSPNRAHREPSHCPGWASGKWQSAFLPTPVHHQCSTLQHSAGDRGGGEDWPESVPPSRSQPFGNWENSGCTCMYNFLNWEALETNFVTYTHRIYRVKLGLGHRIFTFKVEILWHYLQYRSHSVETFHTLLYTQVSRQPSPGNTGKWTLQLYYRTSAVSSTGTMLHLVLRHI